MNVEKPQGRDLSQKEKDRIEASRTISDAGLLEKGASFKDGKMVDIDQKDPRHEMHMETVKGYKELYERRVMCWKLIEWSGSLNKNEMYVPDNINKVRGTLASLQEGLRQIGAGHAETVLQVISKKIESEEYLKIPLEERARAVGVHELYDMLLSYEEALDNATNILLAD